MFTRKGRGCPALFIHPIRNSDYFVDLYTIRNTYDPYAVNVKRGQLATYIIQQRKYLHKRDRT